MICRNARAGARTIYVDRRWLRKCVSERTDERAARARRNLIFPRLTFHLIYLRLFGLRRWLLDGRGK